MLRRKILINLMIILACGVVALSLPVIVNSQQASPSAASNDFQTNVSTYALVCEFVGDNCANSDRYLVWQIFLTQGNCIVATWKDIYQSICNNPKSIIYDTEYLKLTAGGLTCRNIALYEKMFTENYSSDVTFKGYTAKLTLPTK